MVLLETLTPEERAVFLLREVFDYEYAEIADMLDLSSANCRQLFHRAKERLAERKPRFRASVDEKRPLVERFVHAFSAGNEEELTSVLAADVGFWSDGGGKVLAAQRPVFGREAVAHMLVGLPADGAVRWHRARRRCGSRSSTSTTSRRMLMRIDGRLDSRLHDDGRGRRDHRDARRPQSRQAHLHRAAV